MRTLFLILKGQWFQMIASGEKKEEYRDIVDHWYARLMNYDLVSRSNYFAFRKHTSFKHFDAVIFQHGYGKDAPRVTVKCLGIETGRGKPEWGAELGKEYFVIKLGDIIVEKVK